MGSDSCLRSEMLCWGGWWYPRTWAGCVGQRGVGWCEGCLTICGSGDEGFGVRVSLGISRLVPVKLSKFGRNDRNKAAKVGEGDVYLA